MKKQLCVLIVDDNPILRKELRSLFAPHQEFEVIGEAGDGLEAIDSVKKLNPDLIMMDLSMPRMGGLAATEEIKKQWPETKILVFTIYNSPEYQKAALNAGADGYITKESTQAELFQSIQDILDGQ